MGIPREPDRKSQLYVENIAARYVASRRTVNARWKVQATNNCVVLSTPRWYKKTFKSPSLSFSLHKINSFVSLSRPDARPSPRMQSYRYAEHRSRSGKAICNDVIYATVRFMLCTFRILKYNSLHKQFVHGMKDYDVFPCKFNLIRHFRGSAIKPDARAHACRINYVMIS